MPSSRFTTVEAPNLESNREGEPAAERPVVVRRTAGARSSRRSIVEILREYRQRSQAADD
jgi:hypothetical protein